MSVYGFEGYGWFWAIIESLRQSDSFEINFTSKNYLNGLAYLLRTDKKIAEKFLLDCINEFDLFSSDGDNFWSRSLKERMEFMNDKKQQYKENANKRWEKERQKQQEQATEATSQPEPELDKSKQQKPVRAKNATVAQYSVEVNQLTDLLVEKIKENNPKAQTPNFNQWRDSIRLMIENDKYEFEQIRKMIEYCQSDDFWKSNILSAKKLREKAGTLVLQMDRGGENGRVKTNQQRPKIEVGRFEEYNHSDISPERIEEIRGSARKVEELLRMRKVQG